MKRFAALFTELDRSTRTLAKLAALEAYFRDAPPEDAVWALWLLSGSKLKRLVPGRELREAVARRTGVAPWLVAECYDVVGDLGETLALLLPESERVDAPSLHELIEVHTLPMRQMGAAERAAQLEAVWERLDRTQRFLWHKMMLGSFRVGVARTTVVKALAAVAGVEPAVMAHRMSGAWEPTPEVLRRFIEGGEDGEADALQPFPFCLAHALVGEPSKLGPAAAHLVEWKYDGIRAQVIRRGDHAVLWSRGEELVDESFPELAAAAGTLPEGTVLDGEILAWEDDRPLPFAMLQRRLNRKRVEPSLWTEVPVVFMAFDVLEQGGRDLRDEPLSARRAALEALLATVRGRTDQPLRVSPRLEASSWDDVAVRQRSARERGAEGVMVKRLDAPYAVGRRRGSWWKWKVDPFTVDAVLLYAQRGTGRRAGLFTDYTFGVWDEGELVPVAKAYAGLTDAEFREVNRFIRGHTLGRHGPVHVVEPRLVFELAFEGVAASSRHKAGLALRFPRMLRWRRDKEPDDADALTDLRALLP